MKIFADLHIHSRFARACSKQINVKNLEKWARIKGVNLLGTGDFTYKTWYDELKKETVEDSGGILRTKTGFPFLWQTEISLIYKQADRQRRVHHVVLAPSSEVVDQITEQLGKIGRLDYDGRPIFGMSSIKFAELLKGISKDIEIIPAHCLLPETPIHTKKIIEPINILSRKSRVLTHTGVFKQVKKILSRDYSGPIVKIIPWYFTLGLKTTPEHPFYAIKSYKNCKWTNGTCRPTCSEVKGCRRKYFQDYFITWIPAEDLKVGDILVYPKIKRVYNKKQLNIGKVTVPINNEFCRLVGYFLAEGYSNGRDAISFTFNQSEKEYILDLKKIMKQLFNLNSKKGKSHYSSEDIIFYSRELAKFFEKKFYNKKRGATNKRLPNWMLFLPFEQQAEILRGWWRGDKGYTSSRMLMNQMKIICLRLDIIPSIRVDKAERHLTKKHLFKGRRIIATADNFSLDNLSFFSDKYNLLSDPDFAKFKTKRKTRHGWTDEDNVYLPICKISVEKYKGKVYNLEVEDDNSYVTEFATIHNCWTPWYAIFGSKSGFDSVEECFGDQAKYIYALETGLSSDLLMNWRISALDKYNLVSFSDSHSFWPWRLGREATIFDLKNLTYKNIIKAIRTRQGFVGTIEFWPHEGKYHYDGHRVCGVCMSPSEAIKNNNICPVCKQQLTIGVAHRVEELADRPVGYIPKNAPFYKNLIPLSEVIAGVLKTGVATQKTWRDYNKLIKQFGSEVNVLLNVSENELKKVVSDKLANMIIKNRNEQISVNPGFDGKYGRPIFNEDDVEEEPKQGQKSLLDY